MKREERISLLSELPEFFKTIPEGTLTSSVNKKIILKKPDLEILDKNVAYKKKCLELENGNIKITQEKEARSAEWIYKIGNHHQYTFPQKFQTSARRNMLVYNTSDFILGVKTTNKRAILAYGFFVCILSFISFCLMIGYLINSGIVFGVFNSVIDFIIGLFSVLSVIVTKIVSEIKGIRGKLDGIKNDPQKKKIKLIVTEIIMTILELIWSICSIVFTSLITTGNNSSSQKAIGILTTCAIKLVLLTFILGTKIFRFIYYIRIYYKTTFVEWKIISSYLSYEIYDLKSLKKFLEKMEKEGITFQPHAEDFVLDITDYTYTNEKKEILKKFKINGDELIPIEEAFIEFHLLDKIRVENISGYSEPIRAFKYMDGIIIKMEDRKDFITFDFQKQNLIRMKNIEKINQ